MKIAKKSIAIVSLFLLLTIVGSMIALPNVNATTPPRTWPTVAYVVATPNPVGVGQSVGILMFIDKAHPTSRGEYGGRFHGLTLDVTKPDNKTETLGPYNADAISYAYASYTPDQLGTYTLVFHFPQTLIVDENPPPFAFSSSQWNPEKINDTFAASTSEPFYLTVQEKQVPSWQETPLPTDYWTGPVNALNRNWWAIAGDWLGGAQSGIGKLMPYTTGPESAHILWTKPFWSGGIAGGEAGSYSYLSSAGRDNESPYIINGRIYLRDRGSTDTAYGWYCIDLYTGKTLWYKNDIAYPSFASVMKHDSLSQMLAKPYLWSASGSNWTAIDAFSGNIVFNITNAQSTGTAVYGQDGSILRYRIDGTGGNKRLILWNTTEVTSPAAAVSPNRPGGYTGNYNGATSGISLNVSIPNVQGSIFEVIEGKWVIGGVAGKQNQTAVEPGHIWTLSLQRGQEGTLISNITFNPPKQTMDQDEYYHYGTGGPGVGKMHGPFVYSGNGVFVFYEGVSRQWWGYSLETGQKLWGPTKPQSPMMSYSEGIPYVAYGILYTSAAINQAGGEIHAYNITTGDELWAYYAGTTALGESYYDNTPTSIQVIADGKIYTVSKEHIPLEPLRRDAAITCIDAFTGEELWKIPYYPRNALAVSRGYLVGQNSHDGQMYVFGKGPSATTVSASPKVSAYGSSVLIEGTVTDQSPGAPDTPAIADADQEAWMQYVYMQQPKPTNVSGVLVSLDTLDPNGNMVHIENVTSDSSGTFGFVYTPEVPGKYTIIASFAGSKSYGSSTATTTIGVSDAQATPAPTAVPESIADTYFVPATVGIIIAIAIVVALQALLLLRKRP